MPRIHTEADAAPYIARIKRWMQMNGFAGLDRVRVVIRDMYYQGLAQCGSDIVYIQRGLDELRFCAMLAHELTHHWLYKNRHESGGFSGEGCASWTEYKFLQQIGTPEALRYSRVLLTSHPTANGIDYSVALAHMLRRAS